jgi:hypothetical protein
MDDPRDRVLRLACRYGNSPRDVAASKYRQKFLNSFWNLYSFVGLATQRGDRVGFLALTLSKPRDAV